MEIILIGVAGALILLGIAIGLYVIGTRDAVIDTSEDEPVLYTDILDSERPYYEQFY